MMALNNGSADAQPDPHTRRFRRIKRFEQLLHRIRFDTHPRVPHIQADMIALISLRFNEYLPRTFIYPAHRVRGVQEDVEDNLLKLHAIADDGWKVLAEILPHGHPVS